MGTDPQGAASSALLIPRMAFFAASLSLVYASSLYSSPLSGRLPRLYLDGFAGGPYEGYPDIWEPMGDGEGIAFKRGGQGTYRSDSAMYPGSVEPWGKFYGGVDNRAQCTGLPKYPKKSGPMQAAGDDLITLCQYGFDKKVRQEGGGNPTIQDVQRVKCPRELVEFTWVKRNDDPTSYKSGVSVEGFPNDDHKCEADIPGHGTAWCLTRMMDCRKPSGAFKDNMKSELMMEGMKIVQPCASDGYTRYDVQCGCLDCYC